MSKRRRIAIAVQVDRVVQLRTSAVPIRAGCPACGAEVLMASPETAALLAGVGVRAVYRAIEAGTIHFVESSEDLVLVCLRSLGFAEDLPE
jgi:hypothetical protein